jgi:hypothetical protein
MTRIGPGPRTGSITVLGSVSYDAYVEWELCGISCELILGTVYVKMFFFNLNLTFFHRTFLLCKYLHLSSCIPRSFTVLPTNTVVVSTAKECVLLVCTCLLTELRYHNLKLSCPHHRLVGPRAEREPQLINGL